ncbi:metal ABC transporter ATP-binding protein [Candidatus Fermentibacteria bacterium]|nr:metal ABC transporter ATP-binding protein [Candidatus Fermentibacteria bacterium]
MRLANHDHLGAALAMKEATVRLGDIVALQSVTLTLHQGEQVAVVGPNGAGKSTLLKTIAGLLQPSSGSVLVYGHRPPGHICIAYLPQRNVVDWAFPVTVGDVVMMGRIGRLGLFRRPSRHDHMIVAGCLNTVGLSDLLGQRIAELSGGQQQRMFIARALAQEAGLMVMDEPLTGLDATSQEAILDLLAEFPRRNVATVVTNHDLTMSSQRFDRIVLLNSRVIADGPPEKVLTEKNLLAAYGSHVHRIHDAREPLAVSDSCCDP